MPDRGKGQQATRVFCQQRGVGGAVAVQSQADNEQEIERDIQGVGRYHDRHGPAGVLVADEPADDGVGDQHRRRAVDANRRVTFRQWRQFGLWRHKAEADIQP